MRNEEAFNANKFKPENLDYKKLFELTAREAEIITIFSRIKGTHKSELVASILNISYHTLKSHMSSIYKKLKVTNITDMLIVAHNIGEINLNEVADDLEF